MTRVKRGNVARKRRKKVLKLTEGFRGASSTLFRTANQHAIKALSNASRDRQHRKREFRALWITRINGAVRNYGLNYNVFIAFGVPRRGANVIMLQITIVGYVLDVQVARVHDVRE